MLRPKQVPCLLQYLMVAVVARLDQLVSDERR